ncbi:translocation/assembly module TamB domain-containing protein [Minwuia sp.]|uniref:translocation/assembly module TamB domain-containing protein n=1 Tax=Minwuia sp. TaxID=2493630 RepID=UPI003A934D94
MRRARKIILWGLALLMLPVLIVAGAAFWFVYIAGGDVWTAALGEVVETVSSPDMDIETGGFERDADGVLRLDSLTLADTQGVWLRAEDIALDIAPTALLEGLARIDAVSVKQIEVLRAPVSEGPVEVDSEPFVLPDRIQFPALPVDIRLSALRVDELILAEGLMPQRTRFSIDGEMSVDDANQTLNLNVVPLDLDDSHIRARLDADARANRLRVDISANVPVVEALAEPLGVPAGNRATLSLKGGGPLDDAVLELDLNIDGVADLVGDIALSLGGENGTLVKINTLTNLRGGVAAEPAQAIGRSLELVAQLRLPTTEYLRVERLDVQAEYLSAGFTGEVDLDGRTVLAQGNAVLHHHDGLDAYLSGASFDTVTLSTDIQGPMDEISARLNVVAAQPAFAEFAAAQVDLAIEAVTDLESATGTLRTTIRQASTADAQLDAMLGRQAVVQTRFAADEKRVELDDLRIESAIAQGGGSVAVDLTTMQADGRIRVQVPELANVPQLAGLLNSGQGALGIEMTDFSEAGGEAIVHLQLENLAWQEDSLRSLVGETLTVAGKAGLEGEAMRADLNIHAAGGLDGDVTASMKDETVDGTYSILMTRLPESLVPPALAGLRDVKLDGTLTGTVDQLVTEGQLTAASLKVGDIGISSPRIDYTASDLTGSPTVRLNAQAGVMGAPFRLATRVRADLAANRIIVSDTDMRYRSASVKGKAAVNLASTAVSSNLAIAAAQLSDFSELAGVPLSGTLRGTVDVVPRGSSMTARVNLSGSDIRADSANIRSVDANLLLTDLLAKAPGLGGDIRLTGISAEGAGIERAEIALSGDINAPEAAIEVTATEPQKAVLRTRLAVDLNNPEALSIAFRSLELEAEQGTISSQSPFVLTMPGDTIRVSGLDLTSSFGGRITGDATYGPTRVDADLKITDLPLGPLAAIGGVAGIEGQANAAIRMDTAASGDKGGLDITVSGLRVPELPSDTPFNIQVTGAWRAGQALIDAQVSGPFEQPLVAKLAGDLPFPRGSALPEVPTNGDVSGEVRWSGDLRRILALLPSSDHLAAGPARIDVSVDGTWARPRLKGQVKITNARYENLLSGTQLRQINADVTFDDTGTGRFSLSANDPAGGSVNGRGDMVLLGDDTSADIRIDVNRLLAFRRDEARAIMSGSTHVTWDGEVVNVMVRETLEEVEIYLASPDLPPSVVAIELERDKKPEEEKKEKAASPVRVNLDIEVTSPGRFFLRGRGLESEWRGTVSVKGDAEDPVIRTNFNAIRGSLSLLGRNFRLDEGSLKLTEDLQPEFRIELVRETADLTGRIIVSGNPQQPDIAFTSEPELPQEEVLPRLMFDKSKQSLSPLEAVNLAQGIRTLTNGKPGTTDKIRDAIGLDVLRFEEGDTADSAGAVSVGRYVRDGVYVGAKKSVDSDAGSVVVEIDLLPNVKVDTEVGQDGGTSTGITWEKKY